MTQQIVRLYLGSETNAPTATHAYAPLINYGGTLGEGVTRVSGTFTSNGKKMSWTDLVVDVRGLSDDDLAKLDRSWDWAQPVEIRSEDAAQVEETPVVAEDVEVKIHLDQMSDVYLRFSAMPSAEIRTELKANRWHWNGFSWGIESTVPAPEGFSERVRTFALPLLRRLFPNAALYLSETGMRSWDKALLREWIQSGGVVLHADGESLSQKATAKIMAEN